MSERLRRVLQRKHGDGCQDRHGELCVVGADGHDRSAGGDSGTGERGGRRGNRLPQLTASQALDLKLIDGIRSIDRTLEALAQAT